MTLVRGRFAPSPSGPLHQGSVVAALGSYLCARSKKGEWWVRIEDIDPPREAPGASDTILRQLEFLGLYWDGVVTYQSRRQHLYSEWLHTLQDRGLTYPCGCTRREIQNRGVHLRSQCVKRETHAIRFLNQKPIAAFEDQRLGWLRARDQRYSEDFTLRRRDGYWSYQFAVTVDDALQGMTEIVRGEDLAEATFWQLSLREELTETPLRWTHLPLVTDSDGRKYSKQNQAPPILTTEASASVFRALQTLGFEPPRELNGAGVEELLDYAMQHAHQTLPLGSGPVVRGGVNFFEHESKTSRALQQE